MKRLLFLLCFVPALCLAQTNSSAVDSSSKGMMAFKNILDIKLFHDPLVVNEIFQTMRENESKMISSGFGYVLGDGTEAFFDKKDSEVLQSQINRQRKNKNLLKTSVKEQEKAVQTNPYEAFVSLVGNYKVEPLTQQEFDTLTTVDKKAIPNALNMMTDAGPDVGASTVSVIYNEDIIPQ